MSAHHSNAWLTARVRELEAENKRLRHDRDEWQEVAEAYAQNDGLRVELLERINAACGRALAGDHDKPSMLATLKLCAELARSWRRGATP